MNFAACTLSDIFACGGKPLLFCNSLNCEHGWDTDYIDSIARGISSILDECGAGFIGGDFGYSEKWNFTGVVIGETDKAVKRTGAKEGDLLYISGEIGSGNFEAGSQFGSLAVGLEDLFIKNPVVFPLRNQEAELVSKYASACIDTSDGLFTSLSQLAELNNLGFTVSDIPYINYGKELTDKLGLMEEVLFFGECGEYELLMAVSPENEQKLLSDAEDIESRLYKIGVLTADEKRVLISGDREMLINDYDISARDFRDHNQYIKRLIMYLRSKLSGNG
jgi:thiamine-monophosphate kinase